MSEDASNTSKVFYPSSLSIENLCNFSGALAKTPTCENLIIDTKNASFFSPTALIFLAKVGGTRNRRYPDEKVSYYGLERHTYANNLGFSDALNLVGTPYPQGAYGNKNYIPMSSLSRTELEADVFRGGIEVGDAIQNVCDKIAPVVARSLTNKLSGHLANAFREVFRNTFEHSESDNAVYCAQYWQARDEVEICVADRGIGIRKSLMQDTHNKPSDDLEAIKLAIMPGISSKARAHKK